jgi:hypothetical protein
LSRGTTRLGRAQTPLEHLQTIAHSFPEAERVDVEAWGDEVTFRVCSRNFAFTSPLGASMTAAS